MVAQGCVHAAVIRTTMSLLKVVLKSIEINRRRYFHQEKKKAWSVSTYCTDFRINFSQTSELTSENIQETRDKLLYAPKSSGGLPGAEISPPVYAAASAQLDIFAHFASEHRMKAWLAGIGFLILSLPLYTGTP